jgi:hypothetical protein
MAYKYGLQNFFDGGSAEGDGGPFRPARFFFLDIFRLNYAPSILNGNNCAARCEGLSVPPFFTAIYEVSFLMADKFTGPTCR